MIFLKFLEKRENATYKTGSIETKSWKAEKLKPNRSGSKTNYLSLHFKSFVRFSILTQFSHLAQKRKHVDLFTLSYTSCLECCRCFNKDFQNCRYIKQS